jgi:hypothetical protein
MTDDEQQYEYAVMFDLYPDEIHRGPWSKDDVLGWIEETELDGFRKGAFYPVRRPIGDWERFDD